ncbi:hypothetical protein [Bacillus phage DZ1]|uniref:Uncharacterized protein n=1 Tax=Bacillus phage DZ1 TaxID=3075862 RepID=A0AA96EL85_9CAUD|nr:hypothetical protein [Bacillus phage DZ1]
MNYINEEIDDLRERKAALLEKIQRKLSRLSCKHSFDIFDVLFLKNDMIAAYKELELLNCKLMVLLEVKQHFEVPESKHQH